MIQMYVQKIFSSERLFLEKHKLANSFLECTKFDKLFSCKNFHKTIHVANFMHLQCEKICLLFFGKECSETYQKLH